MTGKELRNLQESYFEMYNELDESKGEELRKKHKMEPGETASQRLAARAHDKEFNIPRQTPAQILDNPHLDKKKTMLKKLSRKAWSRVEQNNEAVDLYDVVLSHLLDEGYADTQQAAKAIMANMSEEWIDSIVDEVITEGEKPFPYQKVDKKQASLRPNLGKDGKSFDRVVKMGMAKRRAKEAEKTGGSQQNAGKGWYHGK